MFQRTLSAVSILAVAAVFATGCDDNRNLPATARGIAGIATLFDQLSGEGITVTVKPSGVDNANAQVKTAKTNMLGEYAITDLAAGVYVVEFSADTYSTIVLPNIIVSNSENGVLRLPRISLSRVTLSASGQEISTRDTSLDGSVQIYTINDVLSVLHLETGKITPIASKYPFVNAYIARDNQHAVFMTGNGGNEVVLAAGSVEEGNTTTPVVFTTNAQNVWITRDSQTIFFLARTTQNDRFDLWKTTFADPANATLVAADVEGSSVREIFDNVINNNFHTNRYRTIGIRFDDNLDHELAIGMNTINGLRDVNLLDFATGTLTTTKDVVDWSDFNVINYASGYERPRVYYQLIKQTVDMVDEEAANIVYWWPRNTTFTPVNSAPLSNVLNVQLDTETSRGHAYLFVQSAAASMVDAKRTIYGLDFGAMPNVRVLIEKMDPAGSDQLLELSRQFGRRIGDKLYFLAATSSDSSGKLIGIDITTATASTIFDAMTPLTQSAFGSATLTNFSVSLNPEPGIPVANREGPFLIPSEPDNINVRPVIVDEMGAHPLSNPLPVNGLQVPQMSRDESTVGFLIAGVGVRTAPVATGALSSPIAAAANSQAFALSHDGSKIAYSTPSPMPSVHVVNADGTGDTNELALANNEASKIVLTQQGLFAASGGEAHVALLGGAQHALPGIFDNGNLQVEPFADGTRILINTAGSVWYNVGFSATEFALPPTANTENAQLYMNEVRTRGFMVNATQITAIQSNNTIDIAMGNNFQRPNVNNLYPLYPNLSYSPDGKNLFFVSNGGFDGKMLAYTESGEEIILAERVIMDLQYVRSMPGGGLAILENIQSESRFDLIGVDLNAPRHDVVAFGVANPNFNTNNFPNSPLFSDDGSEVFGMGDPNTLSEMPMKRSYELRSFSSTLRKVTSIATNTPFEGNGIDPITNSLFVRKDVDSRFGTFTAVGYLLGSGMPFEVAQRVHALVPTPDRSKLALLTIDTQGKTELRSGPIGQPLTTMGEFNSTVLSEEWNIAFSGDGSTLFATEVANNNGNELGGRLLTGKVGAAGLTPVTANVFDVRPNQTGSKAAVVVSNPAIAEQGLAIFSN